MLSKRRIDRIVKILNEYDGDNPIILNMKRQYSIGKFEFTDFNIKYLNENKDFITKDVNKIVNITTEYSKILSDKYKITDFIPTKIWIGKIIGEVGMTYHCYAQFR